MNVSRKFLIPGGLALAALCIALLLGVSHGAGPDPNGIRPSDIAKAPDQFPKVLKEPAPALVGSWECVHMRSTKVPGEYSPEPVQFYLAKRGDKYALFFHRYKPSTNRIYTGWRDWVIEGSEIRSETGVKIVAEGDRVFYVWKDDKPTEMTRFEIK